MAKPSLDGNELKYVTDCIESNWISSQGDYIRKFEEGFSKFCERKYGVATSSGTTALHLALTALGVGPGDEVIVPCLTFVATASVVKHCGAKPVFVDADERTWNIDVNKIEEKITKKTKAIIPVHLYGAPCDMDPIMKIAKKHKLFVIEDAAEAHGAKYKGKKVGSFGDISCFSFFANKIITTGEGGMCVTNNKALVNKIKLYRDHGRVKGYWHPVVGYNYRMTNLQGALGLAQLEEIDHLLIKRRYLSGFYSALLEDVKGITFQNKDYKNVCWMYSVLFKDRKKVEKALKENEIDYRLFFYPLNKLPPYRDGKKYPVAEKLSKHGINLPTFIDITTQDMLKIGYVIEEALK